MSQLADLRPPAADLLIRPGTTITVLIEWSPTGVLDGRTFTSTLGATNLPVTVDGDNMTIVADDTVTGDLPVGVPVEWQLLEDVDGTNEPIVVSTWTPSDKPQAVSSQSFQVTQGNVTLTFNLATSAVASVNGQTGAVSLDAADVGADPAGSADGVQTNLDTHEAQLTNDVHGVRRFDPDVDSTAAIAPETMTADGPQVFTKQVVDGRLVVTGTETGFGSLREALILNGSGPWTDSEMRSLIWGPTGWNGTNAQQGHIHRVRMIDANTWEGIAVWTSVVFGQDYGFLQHAGIRFDGTTLDQSDNGGGLGASDQAFIDRRVQVIGHERIAPFGLLRAIVKPLNPDRFQFIEVDDLVTASSFDDTEYNETDAPIVENTEHGQLTYENPAGASGVQPWTPVRRGLITPSGGDSQKRWVPYWLSTRVIGGTSSSVTVEAKRWRLGEPEPDWGDARVQRSTVDANAGVPEIATQPGQCALWAAHFHTGSSGAYGQVQAMEI